MCQWVPTSRTTRGREVRSDVVSSIKDLRSPQPNNKICFGYIHPAITVLGWGWVRGGAIPLVQDTDKVNTRNGFVSSGGIPNYRSPMLLPLLPSQVVEAERVPQFRPHRAAILLRHVESVFHQSSSTSQICHILPLTRLDVPQRILVSFSRAIFWAWTQWNDGRIAGIESILIWVCDPRFAPFLKI